MVFILSRLFINNLFKDEVGRLIAEKSKENEEKLMLEKK
jgi:hypothetical protein